MRIYTNKDVLTAAKERIRYIFSEFPNIVCAMSGGKDSTTVFNLCLEAAKELNRLPLSVFWLDQEAEWQSTADYVESIMLMPEVKPYWYQIPMVMTNNASTLKRYSHCWKDGDVWLREKHSISIKVNNYGTERFHELLEKIQIKDFPKNTAIIGGVRAQESPNRFTGLTSQRTYKHITYGKKLDKSHFVFYPIYDWEIPDVWLYIHKNKIAYNRIYDLMYNIGVNYTDMRVSNLHHETAVKNLFLVQELEPETWEKLIKKVDGVNSLGHLKFDAIRCPKELPYMFETWRDYAFYLADKLIVNQEYKKKLFNQINGNGKMGYGMYDDASELAKEQYWKAVINTILVADWDFTKLNNFSQNNRLTYLHQLKSEKHRIKLKHYGWDKIQKDGYLSKEQKEAIWKMYYS